MTHVQVTQYIEQWLGKSILALNPGVYPYTFVQDLFGEAFLQDHIADGTFILIDSQEDPVQDD